jgi:hypothetical protein
LVAPVKKAILSLSPRSIDCPPMPYIYAVLTPLL